MNITIDIESLREIATDHFGDVANIFDSAKEIDSFIEHIVEIVTGARAHDQGPETVTKSNLT
jgi:hypothetical protein